MEAIEKCTQPLIGLQHVHEYHSDTGQPIFWCGLCDMSCSSSMHAVIAHVSARKHRVNYMKLNYLSYFAIVEERRDDPAVLLEYARVIECEEGRQNVRVCEGPIPAIVLEWNLQTPDSSTETLRARPIFLGDATICALRVTMAAFDNTHVIACCVVYLPLHVRPMMIGQALHRLALASGAKNVGTMLHPMIPTLVTNDVEAAKALEAANQLTRALLEYRLNGGTSELNDMWLPYQDISRMTVLEAYLSVDGSSVSRQ